MGLIPGLGRSPGEGNGNPTPVFLPGKSHGLRRLVGYSPWGCRVWQDLAIQQQWGTRVLHALRRGWENKKKKLPAALQCSCTNLLSTQIAVSSQPRGKLVHLTHQFLPGRMKWDLSLVLSLPTCDTGTSFQVSLGHSSCSLPFYVVCSLGLSFSHGFVGGLCIFWIPLFIIQLVNIFSKSAPDLCQCWFSFKCCKTVFLCFMLFVLLQKSHPSQHHKNNLLCFIFKILRLHIHVFNPPSMYFRTVL